MAIPQAKFREIVFQLLYSRNCSHSIDDEMIPLLMKELAVTKNAVRQALEKVERIIDKQDDIDASIAGVSHSYAFQRIQSVELNVLRLGAFELLHDDSIPPLVAIAEAMRLARKFGSPESSSFVNAILDNLYKSMQGEQINETIIKSTLAAMEQTETLSQMGHEVREKEKHLQQSDESTSNS